MPGRDVSPAITDKPAPVMCNGVIGGGLQKHARLGLPARASVGVDMRADPDIVDLDTTAKLVVHGSESGGRRASGRDIRLVGDNHDHEACALELAHRFGNTRKNLEILQTPRRDKPPVALDVGIQYAIAIQEYRARYHLVAITCSFGWETRQCQTTA
jgi:hypothetical protein